MTNQELITIMHNFKTSSKCFRPDFHVGAPKKHKIVTKSISYKRDGKILFQKVVLGYELPFVQAGSSKNVLKHVFLHEYVKNKKNGNTPPPHPPLTPIALRRDLYRRKVDCKQLGSEDLGGSR